jgi:capsular polysaccharide biosynthesis protein
MNLSINKDESIVHLNNEKIKEKELKRRYSNFSIQNTLKNSNILQSPTILNESISKLNLQKNSNILKKIC